MPMISIKRPILVDVLSVEVLLVLEFLPVGLRGEQFGSEKQIKALPAK